MGGSQTASPPGSRGKYDPKDASRSSIPDWAKAHYYAQQREPMEPLDIRPVCARRALGITTQLVSEARVAARAVSARTFAPHMAPKDLAMLVDRLDDR